MAFEEACKEGIEIDADIVNFLDDFSEQSQANHVDATSLSSAPVKLHLIPLVLGLSFTQGKWGLLALGPIDHLFE